MGHVGLGSRHPHQLVEGRPSLAYTLAWNHAGISVIKPEPLRLPGRDRQLRPRQCHCRAADGGQRTLRPVLGVQVPAGPLSVMYLRRATIGAPTTGSGTRQRRTSIPLHLGWLPQHGLFRDRPRRSQFALDVVDRYDCGLGSCPGAGDAVVQLAPSTYAIRKTTSVSSAHALMRKAPAGSDPAPKMAFTHHRGAALHPSRAQICIEGWPIGSSTSECRRRHSPRLHPGHPRVIVLVTHVARTTSFHQLTLGGDEHDAHRGLLALEGWVDQRTPDRPSDACRLRLCRCRRSGRLIMRSRRTSIESAWMRRLLSHGLRCLQLTPSCEYFGPLSERFLDRKEHQCRENDRDRRGHREHHDVRQGGTDT